MQELLEDFAFPASRVEAQLRGGAGDGGGTAAVAVCPGPDALRAALDLLVALCTQSPENLAACAALLSDMFYADQPPLQEWEYLPPVGPRPRGGFVGLKNAGATCYMNSVLQQVLLSLGCDSLWWDGSVNNILAPLVCTMWRCVPA